MARLTDGQTDRRRVGSNARSDPVVGVVRLHRGGMDAHHRPSAGGLPRPGGGQPDDPPLLVTTVPPPAGDNGGMHATLSRDLRAAVDGSTGRRAEDYLPLVRATVGRVARRVPRHVERDDLMGAGMEGLAQALRSFEPSRGIGFETFAVRRIRGAVLDELRRRGSGSARVEP